MFECEFGSTFNVGLLVSGTIISMCCVLLLDVCLNPLSPRVLSAFRPTNVCHTARPEEPHGSARGQLRRQGERRWCQLHHGGLEGVHVQHLAPGANAQVSCAPQL